MFYWVSLKRYFFERHFPNIVSAGVCGVQPANGESPSPRGANAHPRNGRCWHYILFCPSYITTSHFIILYTICVTGASRNVKPWWGQSAKLSTTTAAATTTTTTREHWREKCFWATQQLPMIEVWWKIGSKNIAMFSGHFQCRCISKCGILIVKLPLYI